MTSHNSYPSCVHLLDSFLNVAQTILNILHKCLLVIGALPALVRPFGVGIRRQRVEDIGIDVFFNCDLTTQMRVSFDESWPPRRRVYRGWISNAVGSCRFFCRGAHDDEYYSRLELSDDSDIEDSLLFF